jgi:hypothetical protein
VTSEVKDAQHRRFFDGPRPYLTSRYRRDASALSPQSFNPPCTPCHPGLPQVQSTSCRDPGTTRNGISPATSRPIIESVRGAGDVGNGLKTGMEAGWGSS